MTLRWFFFMSGGIAEGACSASACSSRAPKA